MQGLVVQYTPLPSYQVPVGNDSQNMVQPPFQQPMLVPANTQMSSSPVTSPTQSPAPSPVTSLSSVCTGLSPLPVLTQFPRPGGPAQGDGRYSLLGQPLQYNLSPGVVVMQLNVLSGAQVPQNPSMVQWSHCKYYNMDQWGQKPGDLYSPDSSPQANTQTSSSPVTSPTQSPAPSPVTSLSSVCTGLSPLPVLTQFPQPGGPAQGDGRYSLLGQPLQYNLSICPPLLHGQSAYTGHKGQSGLKHGNWSKRRALKSAPTDLGTTDVLGRVLEVTDLPEGITDVDKLFTQLAMSSTKIQWLKDAQGLPGGGGDSGGTAENSCHADLAALCTIVAVFPSPLAAQNASLHLNNSVSHFKLQVTKKNYDMRILEQASSQ
ncbi:hypothetical protein CB1_001108007 [Camelus ferus]|nr:hypothetical protein CB1_001108007 [Camelus ferus]